MLTKILPCIMLNFHEKISKGVVFLFKSHANIKYLVFLKSMSICGVALIFLFGDILIFIKNSSGS